LQPVERLSEHAEPSDAQHPGLAGVVMRGVGLAGAGYGITQFVTFVTYLVLAKLISPATFGTFAAASTVVGVGTVVGESGMLAALIHRREDGLDEALNSALLATISSGVLLSLLALATAPLVASFFHNHQAGTVAAVMSGWVFLRLLTIVPDAYLQRHFSFFRRVVADPLAVIAFSAGAIIAAASGMGVWSMVIGTYAGAIVSVVAAWGLTRWRPRPSHASFRMWRQLARFGRPVIGAELLKRVALEIPVLALGRFAGAGPLGQYTYAARVATQPLKAMINVGGYVLLPAFSRIAAEEERFKMAVLRSLRWVCATGFPLGMLLVPLGLPAIVLVFGETWRPAGYGAMALAGYCSALSLDAIATEAWKAYGRPDMLPRMQGLSVLVTTICVGALVPFGLVGVTIGMSLAAIGVATYAVRGMGRALGISIRSMQREIWPAAVAASAMAGMLFCLEYFVVKADQRGTVVGLALVVVEAFLGIAIYLVLLFLLAPDTVRELTSRATSLARSRLASR
jgi:O-antigen/teichoic acid export membrane protein